MEKDMENDRKDIQNKIPRENEPKKNKKKQKGPQQASQRANTHPHDPKKRLVKNEGEKNTHEIFNEQLNFSKGP
jgi:hypothetical protein